MRLQLLRRERGAPARLFQRHLIRRGRGSGVGVGGCAKPLWLLHSARTEAGDTASPRETRARRQGQRRPAQEEAGPPLSCAKCARGHQARGPGVQQPPCRHPRSLSPRDPLQRLHSLTPLVQAGPHSTSTGALLVGLWKGWARAVVTGQEPCTPGPSVHLPDFLSIRHVGRADGDTGWMGAGLAGAGTKAEKTRQLSVPGDPWHWCQDPGVLGVTSVLEEFLLGSCEVGLEQSPKLLHHPVPPDPRLPEGGEHSKLWKTAQEGGGDADCRRTGFVDGGCWARPWPGCGVTRGSERGSGLAVELALGPRGGGHGVGSLRGPPGHLGLLFQLGLQTRPSSVPPFPVKLDGAGLWGAAPASSWGRCEAGSWPSAQNIPPFIGNVRKPRALPDALRAVALGAGSAPGGMSAAASGVVGTLQETWENALGWFLPNLAPPECGLHSILESLLVCLLISCMTDPLLQRILSERTVSAGSKIKHVLREACFHVEAKLETLVDGLCSARLFRMAGGLTSSEPGTITADLSDAADFAPGPQGKLHCRGCAQRLPPPTGRPGDPCLGSSAQRPQGGIKGQGGGEPSAPLRGSDGVAVDGLHPVQTDNYTELLSKGAEFQGDVSTSENRPVVSLLPPHAWPRQRRAGRDLLPVPTSRRCVTPLGVGSAPQVPVRTCPPFLLRRPRWSHLKVPVELRLGSQKEGPPGFGEEGGPALLVSRIKAVPFTPSSKTLGWLLSGVGEGGQACTSRFRPYCDAQQLWRRGAETAVRLSLPIIDGLGASEEGERLRGVHVRPESSECDTARDSAVLCWVWWRVAFQTARSFQRPAHVRTGASPSNPSDSPGTALTWGLCAESFDFSIAVSMEGRVLRPPISLSVRCLRISGTSVMHG
ncbi:unnamed protein product [Rangifer tarandus platyrhynchus]|uniref:Uncharacterized protein n=2 Tax=Rangifer tarandus platyrhynchus TaxID=3082113 RepID=A0ACB0EP97_RANTA|nr:unnamed protein product [Rangifer tarandus platyrhynchus]CAI9702029.1 unnamed protein product [Rangifer tarandus platyrhynchus]